MYDDTLGIKVPRDEGVLEQAPPPDLSMVDFDLLPQYHNVVNIQEANEVIRQYPFRSCYSIYPSREYQTTE